MIFLVILCSRVGIPLSFFLDPENEETSKKRNKVALVALNDMLSWLDHHSHKRELVSPQVGEKIEKPLLHQPTEMRKTPSCFSESNSSICSVNTLDKTTSVGGPFTVGIYDATNSTLSRREAIFQQVKEHGHPMLFIESVCDDEELITANIKEVSFFFSIFNPVFIKIYIYK